MKAVWKYPIPVEAEFGIQMPAGAKVLHVGTQRGNPTLWALVDTDAPPVGVDFQIAGTGHEAPGWTYVGTFLTTNDMYVWHLFQRGAK